ncbi:MAG: tetratricopeptide repeat protein [Candidatus Desulfofervidaceae bacterium]|nr:tetratricopeptide repeat protein [Candidatus Desulfofervidaceae bacterium]
MKIEKSAISCLVFRKKEIYVCLASVFILAFLSLSLQKIHCFDIWWHLATGRWIWTHKTIPFQDVFSYTQKGHPWIDFTWGFQTLVYPIYKWGHFAGLIIFKTLILALAFFFLYKCLRLSTKNSLLVWLLMFFVLFASYPRFMVRPHIFSFLFMSIFLYGLNRYLQSLSWIYSLGLCLAFVIWVNLHGSFLIGLYVSGAYLIGELASRFNWQVKDLLKSPLIQRLGLLCIVLAILAFVNPYGAKLLKFALFSHTGEGGEATKYIAEWRPLPFKEIFLFKFNQALFFKLLFGMVIFSLIWARKPIIIRDVLITSLLSYLTFKHARFMGLFAFTTAPIIAQWFPSFKRESFVYTGILVLSLFFIVKITLLNPYFKKDLGFGVTSRVYPMQTTSFLKRHTLKGNLFNSYGFGGYLIWHLYPQYKVFIDGRTPTIYPPEFYWQYRVAEGVCLKAFKRLAKRYNIKIVLTKGKEFAHLLKKEPDWVLIGFDDRSYLLAQKDILPPSIKPFLHFDPTGDIDKLIAQYKEKKKLSLLVSELKQAGKEFKNVVLIYNNLGLIYAEKKEYKKAIACFRETIRLNPYDPGNYYNLGLAYKNAKRWQVAIKNFKKALSFDKGYAEACYHLGLIYYEKKQYKQTIDYLKKYCKLAGDSAVPSAYEYLGLAYYKTLCLERAIKYFKRAVLVAKTKEEEKKNLYNLGNCYFGLGKYKIAAKYYEKALKLDPKFEKAKFNLKKAKERLKGEYQI